MPALLCSVLSLEAVVVVWLETVEKSYVSIYSLLFNVA
jgi:hypothetical protein